MTELSDLIEKCRLRQEQYLLDHIDEPVQLSLESPDNPLIKKGDAYEVRELCESVSGLLLDGSTWEEGRDR